MARTASEERPAELLERVVDYLMTHAITAVSLRPMAKAIGSSPRVLLYYFGSKEELIAKALGRVRERQRAIYSEIDAANAGSFVEGGFAVWQHMSRPDSEAMFRLFFEEIGVALREPERFKDFLRAAVEDWLRYLEASLRRDGYGRAEARTLATILLAGYRGFMLDYCATRDRARIDRAVRRWLETYAKPNTTHH